MYSKFTKFSGITALALTLVMFGCDDLSEPTSAMAPSDASEILIIETDDNGYTIATETDPTVGVVSALISPNGGSLNIGAHVLTVPAGAVTTPALFTMSKLPGEIKVGLTATRLLPNDVGAAGFKKPVTLSLKYDAASVQNPSSGKIFWVKWNGDMIEMPSTVDAAGNAVIGSLDHFSDYGVGFPNGDGGAGGGW